MTLRKERRRSAYRIQMDAVRLPEEKARSTLRILLKENRKLTAREKRKKPPGRQEEDRTPGPEP